MYTLALETSCDETSAAVIEDGRHIRSNIISTQVPIHRKFGGVVPEIASRQHIEYVLPIIKEALDTAQVTLADIDHIGVTYGPGLVGALLVGKIKNHKEKCHCEKGEEKGYFEYGGSTIIVITEPGVIAPSEALLNNTANDLETKVLQGQAIGYRETIE